jgi:hypothetical protein
MSDIDRQIERLDRDYPLVVHTGAGRLFSTVRRMKAEQELGIPLSRRTGFAISVETGKRGNEMTQNEWNHFYADLCEELRRDYPELFQRLFPEKRSSN